MLSDFIITVHEARKPLAVQIKVHDSVESLRSASVRYTKRSNLYSKKEKKDADFSDVLGICHRFHMSNTPLCAIVRLAPPNLGVGVVSHELAHAALWMWEIHTEFEPESKLNNENDEWFCWVLGELIRQTTLKLYEKGIYPT